MAQEFTPAPEEFSPPPETAALPEEFPALGTREEPPRRGRSRMKYLLAAGLMLLTAAWSLAPDRPAPTSDTPPDVTLPNGSGGPSEADVAELLDTSWQYENGTVVHFADGIGWWEKDGQLLRFTWEAGADVALDAADVVLMKSRLSDVPAAIRLSRATLRNIHQNLFWAFFYNTLGIPLAAGVFVPLGLTLNPMFGAAAMSLSSFCVVSNALRLNLFKLRDPKRDHKRRKKPASANTAPTEEKTTMEKEKEPMKKTMKIEGMMCAHCEATVKKALEAIPEVVDAEVSHTAGTAVVTLQSPVDDAALKKAVEDKDYKVLGIE